MMNDKINQIDLAFVIDTTGSMGHLISVAKKDMLNMIKKISSPSLSMRIAVIAYRDHPPQDSSFVTKIHDFDEPDKCQKFINSLDAGGGGDIPEAVFDGIVAACDLKWRKHARRIAVLIGDAPPHGLCGISEECSCGLKLSDVTEKAEEKSIRFYAISLTYDAKQPFGMICALTGGTCFDTNGNALDEIKHILDLEFNNLKTDEKILDLLASNVPAEDIVTQLSLPKQSVLASIGRLRQRELIEV